MFNSWREAYEFQQSCRTNLNGDEPYYLYDYDLSLDTTTDELVNVVGSTDDEIVWLLSIAKDDYIHFTQYGVGKDQRWYRIEFFDDDDKDSSLQPVEGSLKSFSQLPYLIHFDDNAKAIYKHINEIFYIFEFLANGKIEKDDDIDQRYVDNAERIKAFALTQVSDMSDNDDASDDDHYDENDGDFDDDDDYEDEDFDTDYDDTDEDDEDDEHIDDEEEDQKEDNQDVTLTSDSGISFSSGDAKVSIDNKGITITGEKLTVEDSTPPHTPYTTIDNNEDFDISHQDIDEFCGDESNSDKENLYVFHFAETRDSKDPNEEFFEGTEDEALERYRDFVNKGYKRVEMMKMLRIYVDFE